MLAVFEVFMAIAGVVVSCAFLYIVAQGAFDAIQRRAYKNKKKWDSE